MPAVAGPDDIRKDDRDDEGGLHSLAQAGQEASGQGAELHGQGSSVRDRLRGAGTTPQKS
jgi:hypothetical protein